MRAMQIDEPPLIKGQLRKLNALRSAVGDEIGQRAFLDWLSSQPAAAGETPDKNAALIADILWPLIRRGTPTILRGGYLLGRGRGRIIVDPVHR